MKTTARFIASYANFIYNIGRPPVAHQHMIILLERPGNRSVESYEMALMRTHDFMLVAPQVLHPEIQEAIFLLTEAADTEAKRWVNNKGESA